MDIDIREIIDYSHCPMYYKFKYKTTDLKTETINVLEKYEKDIHLTLYSFFRYVQDKEPMNISNLKKTWGLLWIGNKSKVSILYAEPSSWRDTHNEKRKKGISTIINFYNRFKINPGFPIVINKKYRVEITKTLFLTGAFEVVREIEDKNSKLLEIIDFKIENKLNNKLNIDKDIEITAASYAFRKMFNVNEDRILHYGLDKDKVNYTTRSKEDYKMLFHTIKCVATAIHNNLFYACPDNKCFSCPYRSICVDNLTYMNMIK